MLSSGSTGKVNTEASEPETLMAKSFCNLYNTVLLLNASFEPIRVISWQRAMTMAVTGKVEVVQEYENAVIRTVSRSFSAPAVVRLISYVAIRPRTPRVSRENVWRRDKGLCQYCGISLKLGESTLDHVVPRSRRGANTWQNIVCSCAKCNLHKRNRTPDEARMPLRSIPTAPSGWLPIIQLECNDNIPIRWLQFFRGWFAIS
jgi:5-methylcytosine-specific restriction endonuclease McrA